MEGTEDLPFVELVSRLPLDQEIDLLVEEQDKLENRLGAVKDRLEEINAIEAEARKQTEGKSAKSAA